MTRDLSPPPIDEPLVRRLVAEQFPPWAELPVRAVEQQGHDNRTFRLGDSLSVRLPSAAAYAAHVWIEQAWLPRLAPALPLPIPLPVAQGEPAHGYPWRWSVNRWLEGRSAASAPIADGNRFARDLARFLNALQAIDSTGAPAPGAHNFFRGGDLAVYDAEVRECIAELRDHLPSARAVAAVWEAAREATFTGAPVWVHGDVAAGNLLVGDGELCGVLDFGQLAAGDPSCDVTIAWTLLSGVTRETFRAHLSVDAGTWLRGRGWGLWKALLELRAGRSARAERAAAARRVVEDILGG